MVDTGSEGVDENKRTRPCWHWAEIVDSIVKTVISIQPLLAHNYHSVLPPESTDTAALKSWASTS